MGRYDPVRSETWGLPRGASDPVATVRYSKGEISGIVGHDDVCLAASPGPPPCAEKQPLILAYEHQDLNMEFMDGILGLGFVGLSHTGTTFLRNLNHSFNDLSFAFDLTRLASGDHSYVVFGERGQVLDYGRRQTGGQAPVTVAVVDAFRGQGGAPMPAWWLVIASVSVTAHHPGAVELAMLLHALVFILLLVLFICCACWLSRRGGKRLAVDACGTCRCVFDCLRMACCGCLGLLALLFAAWWVLSLLRCGHFESPVYAALDMFLPTGQLLDDGREVCHTGFSYSLMPIWVLGDVFLRNFYVAHNFAQQTVSLLPHWPAVEWLSAEEPEGPGPGLAAVGVALGAAAAFAAAAAGALRSADPVRRLAAADGTPYAPLVDSEAA